jgi:NADH:ubiquinone oxidoreductase subunit F (NADH-binding)
MTLVHRVLSPHPIATLEEYLERGGGRGLEQARQQDPDVTIEVLRASGLRGRGGAGFPTGVKWRTVRDNASPTAATTVVVNAAEGEPGTFKDRTIMRNDPYIVIEGALIAAHAMGSPQIVLALKKSFTTELERVRRAVREYADAGFTPGIEFVVFEGPNEYLYGEETALLETIDGRYPFPRISPPFRRGVTEVVETQADATSESGLSAHVEMAGPGGESEAPPALVDNVETMANVGRIIARGADWFRTEGTDKSPGTIVCTVTGSTQRHGVGEVIMGTTLREAIDEIGGGPRPGHHIRAVMTGAANAFIPASDLDTPLTYEDMAATGSGLGSGSFIVLDDTVDVVAMAAGASRFLAVESCGQCTPCKQDGLILADLMAALCRSEAKEGELATIAKRLGTIGDRARCTLANQHQVLLGGIFERFADDVRAHVDGRAQPTEPLLVAELLNIDDGTAVLDEHHRDKQPDWSYDAVWSGKVPAEELDDHRLPRELED